MISNRDCARFPVPAARLRLRQGWCLEHDHHGCRLRGQERHLQRPRQL